MGMRIWVVSRRAVLTALVGTAVLLGTAAGALTGRAGGEFRLAPATGDLPPVMIDPGHGGVDGGASSQDILEKDIVLDVGLRLRAALQEAGIPVEMTRETDADLGGPLTRGRHRRDLQERVRRTHECQAAMLISLHANTSRNPQESGMLFLFRQDDALSRQLAGTLAGALTHLHRRREPPIPRSNLFLIKHCQVPAVIVELGFLTNPSDRQKLSDPQYRQQIAAALAGGIARFYGR